MQRKPKSVKQASGLPDGCQQGRFGSAFRCVKDPVRGQACEAGTKKGTMAKTDQQTAQLTWCGHHCRKWELGSLCSGRNRHWLHLSYVRTAQRRPCLWTSGICCHKSWLSYRKERIIHHQEIKHDRMCELWESVVPKYPTYLFSATRRYCLSTGCTWRQRSTIVSSEWRDWWEFLCSQNFPHEVPREHRSGTVK